MAEVKVASSLVLNFRRVKFILKGSIYKLSIDSANDISLSLSWDVTTKACS
jgi:hypothetical protein